MYRTPSLTTGSPDLFAAAAVAASAAIAAAPAAAADTSPWSAPVTISATHSAVGPAALTTTNTSTVAWWRWQDAVQPASKFGGAFAEQSAGSDAFGPERSRTSADELVTLDMQGYGDGRVIALSQVLGRGPAQEGKPSPPDRVLVSKGSASGLGAPTTLARANLIGAAQLGMAPSGRGIVAFASYNPKIAHRAIVSAAMRSSAGRFSRPDVISGRSEAHGVVVAIGRRGDAVVAFVRNKKVVARVRRPGHGWGSIQTLATADGPTQWTLRAAVSDAGSIEVLWHKRFVSDRIDGAALQARRMGPGVSRWGTRVAIEPIGATTPSALISVPGGFAVGYTVRHAAAGAPSTPRVSIVKPRTSTTYDVAPASAGMRGVHVAWSARHGLFATMVLLPAVGDGVGLGVGAFLALGATGFGPIEPVTSGEQVQDLAPGVAPDGSPLAVWSAPTGGTGPILTGEFHRVMRTSKRMG